MLKYFIDKLQSNSLRPVVHFLILPALAIYAAIFIAVFVPLSISINVASSNTAPVVKEMECDPQMEEDAREVKIISISPNSVAVDFPENVKITINGGCFKNTDRVSINKSTGTGTASPIFLETTYVSQTQLTVIIPKENFQESGNFNVVTWKPDPDEPSSRAVTFTVTPIVIESISPEFVILPTTQGVEFGVTGTGFIEGSKIYFERNEGDYRDESTIFLSPTQLKTTIPIAFLNNLQQISSFVYVKNEVGGESSNFEQLSLKRTLLRVVENNIGSRMQILSFGYNIDGLTKYKLTLDQSNEQTIEVKPDTYSITRESKDGWEFGSSDCDKEFKRTGTIANPKVEVEVTAGQTTTCTFTNIKTNPDLTITKITPEEVSVGSPDITVTINGTKFNSESKVVLLEAGSFCDLQEKCVPNGVGPACNMDSDCVNPSQIYIPPPSKDIPTIQFISKTELRVMIPKEWFLKENVLNLRVVNPETKTSQEETSNNDLILVLGD